MIRFDLDCANCQYNLHGLAFDGVCPECGRAIPTTLEQHVRNRPKTKFDSARLSERTTKWLTHVGESSLAAFLANLLGLCGVFLNEWALRRYSSQRVGMLVLLCIAITLAAYSIWRLSFAAGQRFWWMRSLIRVGAVAGILAPLCTTMVRDHPTFGFPYELGNIGNFVCNAMFFVVAVGSVLRIAYVQWWLRIEGFSIFGWPLALSAVPLALTYFAIGLEGTAMLDRNSQFNAFNVFL